MTENLFTPWLSDPLMLNPPNRADYLADASTPLNWGASTPRERGPVLGGWQPRRNAIGVHAGAFAPYQAIAVATGVLAENHRPELTGTKPTMAIGPFPQWSDPGKIVSIDAWGHRVVDDFSAEIASGRQIRPTIAITRGRLEMPEIVAALRNGRLRGDGDILDEAGGAHVTKIAIEPVWWLPGVADRLGVYETVLREALVRMGGGMYPDLITRPDIKVFLPPIGGTSVYLFGDPALLNKADTKVACRMHDECNGSDVFGSDMCTCRPYLAFAMEECVRMAQGSGVGVLIYNRKEGRALGEVVKYLVYNARVNAVSGDDPGRYFARTEEVAGVKDMRCPQLGVDTLHWLGMKRIDRWLSMSNLKRDAVVSAGIEIGAQIELPSSLVSRGADVEISAKIAAGYFTEHGA
jgi:GTP cyclohydrolase II